jgi:hypothetical protein
MGSFIIITTTTTGLLIYYNYYHKNTQTKQENRRKNSLCDAQTQTQTQETPTPPNEINLPDFITVENTIDTNAIDIIDTPPRRSLSLTSFFNYMRNN